MGLRELYGNQKYKQILRDVLQINYDNLERLKWALEDKRVKYLLNTKSSIH
jgi:hypothetical protein